MTKIAEARMSRIPLRRATIVLAALAALELGAVAIPSAKAQSLTVLYRFTGPPDGARPFAGLIIDKKGNLYGTTIQGGLVVNGCDYGCGTVFKLDPAGNETVLHRFTVSDGEQPFAGLIMDKKGNLYGTTSVGGSGTVFKLDTAGNETVLHGFAGPPDGELPYAGLIMDKAGNLYGTTVYGGTSSNCCGIVFKVDTSGNETVLHSFAGPPDGQLPYAGLIMDQEGNLYGATSSGGTSSNCSGGCGTVFKLDTFGNETVVHSFTNSDGDGALPSGLIMDKKGNLYGTTYIGGPLVDACRPYTACGTVFKLDTAGNETVLHSFSGGSDGGLPVAGLIMDKAGNLYGTTEVGGTHFAGTVFKLDSSGNLTVLHSFTLADGEFPLGSLIMDKKGNLYGTTEFGGNFSNCSMGCGTVFKVIP